jgi:outer membrane lipoprotein SlyB
VRQLQVAGGSRSSRRQFDNDEERRVKRSIRAFVSAAALTLGLMAGATAVAQTGEREIRSGVIEQITEVQIPTNQHRGLGAVVGGLGGLGIGSLIGAGTGRDVAMVLGALGGAVMGNNVQKKYDQPEPGQQIIVRVTSGVLVMVTQPVDSRLRQGMPVYIEGNGDGARVIPR